MIRHWGCAQLWHDLRVTEHESIALEHRHPAKRIAFTFFDECREDARSFQAGNQKRASVLSLTICGIKIAMTPAKIDVSGSVTLEKSRARNGSTVGSEQSNGVDTHFFQSSSLSATSRFKLQQLVAQRIPIDLSGAAGRKLEAEVVNVRPFEPFNFFGDPLAQSLLVEAHLGA